MDSTQAEKLANWASMGDREAPVAFVGREPEIDMAIRQLATWRAGETPGRTIVAQGAPGAGKTALLREMARRLPEHMPDACAIYRPTPWSSRTVSNVLVALAERMMGASGDLLRTTVMREGTIGAKAIATASQTHSHTTAPAVLSTWDDFETLFTRQAAAAKPTLLLVDEIQRMDDDVETRELLYHLHGQTTFPILLVCGGLSVSASHLEGLGLSRLAEKCILHVAALTLDEARHSLEESLRILAEDVGGITGHFDQWARRLAPATHGWPQHITCHFQAAVRALLASDEPAFEGGSLRRALALAEADMRSYYDRRLEAARASPLIVYAVYKASRSNPVNRAEAMAIVSSVVPALDPHEREDHRASFHRSGECVDQMLYAGVLGHATASRRSPLGIPIPAMATHVASLLTEEEQGRVHHALSG